ncbi:MAG: GMP/IMP nucleotidase [Gammaproteobacteria bacterium]|nr:GMP/IMP nucleotidase [Gammaproteobacteria bacterium]
MKKLNWQNIETVLLDMDGTLLDLHFDNYFWLHYVPESYAKKNNITFEQAHLELMNRYQKVEGTMQWYCVDYWSEELGLDIALLKEQVAHLIQVHPHVLDFLEQLKMDGKKRVLVTNAHQKSLSLKMRKTPLAEHLDVIISAHELGLPKEEIGFWQQLQSIVSYNPKTTLLVEDNVNILRSAQKYGIKHHLAILKPDSKQEKKIINEFEAVHDFGELLAN